VQKAGSGFDSLNTRSSFAVGRQPAGGAAVHVVHVGAHAGAVLRGGGRGGAGAVLGRRLAHMLSLCVQLACHSTQPCASPGGVHTPHICRSSCRRRTGCRCCRRSTRLRSCTARPACRSTWRPGKCWSAASRSLQQRAAAHAVSGRAGARCCPARQRPRHAARTQPCARPAGTASDRATHSRCCWCRRPAHPRSLWGVARGGGRAAAADAWWARARRAPGVRWGRSVWSCVR
jgi:hypothetical protein